MKRSLIYILIGIFFAIGNVSAQVPLSQGARKLLTTMTLLERMYVDSINENKITDSAITAILSELDPHSSYLTADVVAEMNEPLEGNFDGIGIAFNMMTDTLYVIETISGGPSQKVGLLPGDKIMKVNDTIISGVKMSTRDIMKRLRGKKGTTVSVDVLRRNASDLITFVITRDKIPIYSLDAAYMIDNSTGYIRLNRFGATTVKEFRDALEKLQKKGLKNLILDLEGNGGGYLDAAVELADDFLDKDKLIVYMEGLHQKRNEDKSTAKGMFETGKLVILVDEGSASASEIVAGAIQDWDRGIIVGRRTFGKGLVQRQFPLPDESMIRLTVARYYTPTGRSIQKPYTKGDLSSYNRDVIERYNNGEMLSADSIHFPDSLKYRTLVKKRIVYGGGGIMPDYFVPLDTSFHSNYNTKLNAMGYVYRMALQIVDTERDALLKEYPDANQFIERYEVSDQILQKIIDMATEDKIEYKEDEYLKSKEFLRKRVKLYLVRDLYDNEAFFKYFNKDSNTFLKALDIINNNKQKN